MTRQQKTPKQRAEEALAVAQRKRDRLHADAARRRKELEVVDRDLRDAEARLSYVKADPALPAIERTAHTSGGTTP